MGKYDNLAALARGSDEAGDAVRSVIRAYHGSPHDFDRFDASKIGTGEGAQAYGHGLYFAGAEDVARSYRDITPSLLPPEAAELKQQLSQLFRQHSDLTGELQMAAETDGHFSLGWGKFKAPPEVARARILPQLADVNKQLADVQTRMRNVLAGRRGHMYEVEIDRPEESLLDWDNPIYGQSDAVIDGLKRLNATALGAETELLDGAFGGLAWRTPKGNIVGTPTRNATPETLSFWDTHQNHRHGGAAISDLNALGQSPTAASEALRSVGIPGIRYLDGASRRAGQGTRNYVVFPGAEDSIRILRKYAIPGAVGTGVASQYEEER